MSNYTGFIQRGNDGARRRAFNAVLAAGLFAGMLSVSHVASARAEEAFLSPEGKHRVVYVTGQNAKGTDVKPIRARISPVAGGVTTDVDFQLIRYTEPTIRTVSEAFWWSPGEEAVVVRNRLDGTKYGVRIIPLEPGLAWKQKNLVANHLEWVDRNRLVYHGDGSDGFFIGVFDVRSGRTRIARHNLSKFTDYRILDVTADAINIMESTDGVMHSCYSFNTVNGKRTNFRCPKT